MCNESEEREDGVGVRVNVTLLSDTLLICLFNLNNVVINFITTDKEKASRGGGKVSVL